MFPNFATLRLYLLPLLSALVLLVLYGEGARRMIGWGDMEPHQRIGNFELSTLSGRPFTNANVAGRPLVVFFGFTSCPDVCPTTLVELTSLLGEMGDAANRVTPLFISVDPERDTAAVLERYMSSFDPRIIPLRGTPEQTRQAATAFFATFRKVPLKDGDYTMDHSAGVRLIRAGGALQGTLDMHETRDIQLKKLLNLAHSTSTQVFWRATEQFAGVTTPLPGRI